MTEIDLDKEPPVLFNGGSTGTILLTYSFNISLYSLDMSTPQQKEAVLAIFDEYAALYGSRLNWTTNPVSGAFKHIRGKVDSYVLPGEWLMEEPQENDYDFLYHGGKKEWDSSDVDFMANSHNVVVLGRGAKAQVLVCDHAADEVRFLANRVTEVFVGEQACYEHYKLESTHDRNTNLSALLVEQQEGSNVLANIMTLHSGMTRNLVEIALEGEHCETLLCGMALCDQTQRVDNFTSILHNKPNCHSNSLFKYILDDTSLGGFTGRLVVAQDAQKTQAYQSNKNLLLNHDARMRTKPQLEIYADDVKCSHGATIGQLDEEALFYLRSRGISREEARLLLMFAFTADIVGHVNIGSLQERIRLLVEKRLRHGNAKCDGCAICK